MVGRLQKLNNHHSFFLFGARGTGKSTLVKDFYSGSNTLWIDLLKSEDEERFGRRPDELSKVLSQKKYEKVVIDEIQKSPKLLDIVHLEIERNKNIQFVMTGSSARKLKRGHANLLAGRAFTYYLYPLTFFELEDEFDLNNVLEFGSLPYLLELNSDEDKNEFLRSYVRTYIKEEIQVEQIVRKLNPFRDFLEIAAQSNGEIINYSTIAKQVAVDDKTIKNYFSILEDTLIAYLLPPFHRSIRKRQREAPKFYLFDTGIKRSLEGTLRVKLQPKTFAYGKSFEHLIIAECHRLNEYNKLDYKFSYLRTKDGAEIDLVVQRPGQSDLLIEIKSTDMVQDHHVKNLNVFFSDWDKKAEAELWSLDPIEKKIGNVSCLPWNVGMKKLMDI